MEHEIINLKHQDAVKLPKATLGFIGFRQFGEGLHALLQQNNHPSSKGVLYPLNSPNALEPPVNWSLAASLDQLFKTAEVIFVDASHEALGPLLPRIRLIVSDAHLLVFVGAQFSFKKIVGQINEHKMIRCLTSPVQRFIDSTVVFTASELVTSEEIDKFRAILHDLPVVLQVDSEHQLEAMHGLIGTGPAIGYTLIDALADGLLKLGIPRKNGLYLAAHTLFSATRTFLETQTHPGVLRDQSIQEKGIPLSGLMALEEAGLRGILSKAMALAAQEAQMNLKNQK